MKKKMGPRFIYITGCDGTGKSTLVRLLLEGLKKEGMQTTHLWLRFPFFFSTPFLAFARWKKYSWSVKKDGVTYGYWDFKYSWIMRSIFPWFFLADAAVTSIWRVYLPLLLGKFILCERYVIDMIVDLEVGLQDPSFHKRYPGKLFLMLLPRCTFVFGLDLDSKMIKERRPALQFDQRLEDRLFCFRSVYKDLNVCNESSLIPVQALKDKVFQLSGIANA